MKKILWISVILITFFGLICGYGQTIPVYPIPSANVKVNGNAIFQENYTNLHPKQTRERREVHVRITSASGSHQCQAMVWVYSLDHTTLLGPFIVNCGETLTVEIDEREWGVLVESEEDVIVDVWIDGGGSKKFLNTNTSFLMNVNTLPNNIKTINQKGGRMQI